MFWGDKLKLMADGVQSFGSNEQVTGLPPIRLLEGAAGRDLILEHPGTLRHVAYSLGVLAIGQPEPAPEVWQPRAQKKLEQVTEPELGPDGGELFPSLVEFAQMTVDNAYASHADYETARTDSFGISNRLAVFEELERAMVWANEKPQRARLEAGRPVPGESSRGMGMGILDIDYFKDVNDVLGHAFGDRILLRISDRLQAIMRRGESGRRQDEWGDAARNPYPSWGFVGRLGGDEFAFVLRVHEQRRQAPSGRRGRQRLSLEEVFNGAATRIETELAQELVLINQEIQQERARQNLIRTADKQLAEIPELKASFGWELAGRRDSEAVLARRTDLSMYANKRRGKVADAEDDRRKLKQRELQQIGRIILMLDRPGFARYRRPVEALRELYEVDAA